MARPPHKLKKEKLLEGIGGLRILDDIGVKVHKLKGLKLHAKLILADNVRSIVGPIIGTGLSEMAWLRAASTAAASVPSD